MGFFYFTKTPAIMYPIETAKKVLKDYLLKDNQNLLDLIIKDYKIVLDYWPHNGEILGMFWRAFDNKETIMINKNCTFEQQRFIIAHEIGHFFMDHGNSLCSSDTICSGHGKEFEANLFAAELLLPEKVLRDTFPFTSERDLVHGLKVPQDFISWRLKMLGLC